ncbi:glutathione synthetase, chloroplastic-like isoform X1 [Scaptodrosophila lebanonensis]|uniref:Glutathione synthetase n=1 Tax=Drosophila lebanonensis TaxID=7225 RepID=A0A6J2TN08_DROLE|nr:glutathione synthetase, chloroplastic-like isoform X1 [Scaptodrosophila lebanonensis]XP_030377992.1 glutathione synthetase, chloroplastic-like isoform X1 [Scaptodrosophila lebanonensis]
MCDEANTPTLRACIDLPLRQDELLEVTAKAKDYAIMHGAAMRSKTNYSADALNFAPFVLVPSSFPRKEFEKAIALQPIINRLMHNVAHDEEFITTTLAETVKVDEFTADLFNIYKKVLANGFTQRTSLGMLRSDLMLESGCPELLPKHACDGEAMDEGKGVSTAATAGGGGDDEDEAKGSNVNTNLPKIYQNTVKTPTTAKAASKATSTATKKSGAAYCCWKQVEINTIASGFGHLGPASKTIQSFVLRELGHADKLKNMPKNDALSGLCDGMVKAWDIYGKKDAVILFIIEDISYNICDQRFHEFYIREQYPHIKVVRRTLTDVHKLGKLGQCKELLLDGIEVAVIYFRAGYEPGHYHSQAEWDARYLMECSLAIKCPSIQYHLAGTKKVQQALAQPAVLERFINDPEEIKAVGKIFTGLYSLDDNDAGNSTYEMALKTPERFVLKPQREGGGNNVYGLEIPEALKKMSRVERSAWILMDLIHPPLSKGYMVRPGGDMPPTVVDMVSELGIFGVIIGDADHIVHNYQAGHMLRTKLSTANEGGVAAGLGALDSPYLIDSDDEGEYN